MKVLKKLSVKEINGLTKEATKKLVDAQDGAELFMGRFVGICRNVEVKDTDYGGALKFVGEFRATGRDGEESYAPVAYLPSPFDELLSEQINEIKGADGNAKVSVEFGLDVYAIHDPKGAVGYKFICRPLKEAAPSNPLAALMATFKPLALPSAPAALAIGNDSSEEAPAETPAETPAPTKAKASK